MAASSVSGAARCWERTDAQDPVPLEPFGFPKAGDTVCVEAARTASTRVAARFRLSGADAEDLHGDLWVRLLANDGLVLRGFRHTARIEHFLAAIATNLVIDARRKKQGSWRPSARANRHGAAAIELERLIVRDHLGRDLAVARVMATHPGHEKAALQRLARTLAPRCQRTEVGPEALTDHPAPDPSPYQLAARADAARAASRLSQALARALSSMKRADRDMLQWRYVDGHSVAELSSLLRIDQKALYRRFDRLHRDLKSELEALGFSSQAVREILVSGSDVEEGTLHAPSIFEAFRRRTSRQMAGRTICDEKTHGPAGSHTMRPCDLLSLS